MMQTASIEAIQKELQRLGHERLEPNDPLFLDHLSRRLELQWHYEKINALLETQQVSISTTNEEFAEALRNSYSDWISEGGNHLTECIEQAGDANVQKLNSVLDGFSNNLGNKISSSKAGLSWPMVTMLVLNSFCTWVLNSLENSLLNC